MLSAGMGLFLHKLLPVFLLPIGFCSLLAIWGMLRRRRRWVALAVAGLLVSSLPVTSRMLLRPLENYYPYMEVSDAPTADAIVVLSGMLRDSPPTWKRPVFGDAADRFAVGVALWRAGKAPKLVFTRAQMPWARTQTPEGEHLARLAIAQGVPAQNIEVTNGTVGNTADEAQEIAELVRTRGWRNVVLITSAFHMPRASWLFRRAGVEFVAFPCDQHRASRTTITDYLPSGLALHKTELALREYYGLVYYQFRYLREPGPSASAQGNRNTDTPTNLK
jgi:uncharacterized SAM-binding protein YcdF (DUF218 family)